jgi:hypothetical protein
MDDVELVHNDCPSLLQKNSRFPKKFTFPKKSRFQKKSRLKKIHVSKKNSRFHKKSRFKKITSQKKSSTPQSENSQVSFLNHAKTTTVAVDYSCCCLASLHTRIELVEKVIWSLLMYYRVMNIEILSRKLYNEITFRRRRRRRVGMLLLVYNDILHNRTKIQQYHHQHNHYP